MNNIEILEHAKNWDLEESNYFWNHIKALSILDYSKKKYYYITQEEYDKTFILIRDFLNDVNIEKRIR